MVGTGGIGYYDLGTRRPNSEVFNDSAFGVLRLTLGANPYSWEFIPAAGQRFAETG